MVDTGKHNRRLAAGKQVGLLVAAVLLTALAACGAAQTSGTPATPTATTAPTATASATSTPGTSGVTGYPIKVYFTRRSDSENNFNAVFPVDRVSPTAQVAPFAIQLLIAGPTPEERSAGYYSELNGLFSGPSQCATGPAPIGGPDFTLAQNAQGTATLKFCRTTASPGIGADARVLAEIRATLLQFPEIKKVVVLNIGGHCFGDQTTQDLCLK